MKGLDESKHLFNNSPSIDAPENIYYADLYCINNRHWMIQGYGKSLISRLITQNRLGMLLARDAISIIRKADLFAGYDIEAFGGSAFGTNNLHKLDAIAHCLNREQTLQAFGGLGKECSILETDSETLGSLCASYSFPEYIAQYFYSPAEFDYFANPFRMKDLFLKLTRGIQHTRFLLVPYMELAKDKAQLIYNFHFKKKNNF